MDSQSASLADQISATVRAVSERRIKDLIDIHLRRVAELEAHIRHRDRRIEDLQELMAFKDETIASLRTSLRESNAAVDHVRSENMQLERENDRLQQDIDNLKQRPEPLPCGMPELTRAALDQVRKWDAEARVDGQKKEIRKLREEVERLKTTPITMGEFWRRFQEKNLVEFVPAESLLPEYNPDESIFAFMRRLIIEIQEAEEEAEDEFGFMTLLPHVDAAFGGYSTPDTP
jgi:chromosome segregation ATPase